MKRHLPFLVLLISCLPAMAHPAAYHAMNVSEAAHAGFLHPFTGLDHLLVMVAVGLWAVQLGGRALWLLPCCFVGSMMLGGLIGLCGLHQPLVEHGILASIVLLGVALGVTWRPQLWIAASCVGIAGLCHGYAHGSEMPSGALPLLFFTGMVAATSILHAFGIGGGLMLRSRRFDLAMRATGLLLLAFAVYDFCFPV